jgi:hypothetical protein
MALLVVTEARRCGRRCRRGLGGGAKRGGFAEGGLARARVIAECEEGFALAAAKGERFDRRVSGGDGGLIATCEGYGAKRAAATV